MNGNQGASRHNTSYRVDLTSQDLRTGTIRLPRQLIGKLKGGDLEVLDTSTGTAHQLQVIEPRELHGLIEFFAEHELRTNDAILLRFESGAVELEPYYRNRRRSEVRSSGTGARVTPVMPAAITSQPAAPTAEVETIDAAPTDAPAQESGRPVDSGATDVPADDRLQAAPAAEEEPIDFDEFDSFADLGELDPIDLSDAPPHQPDTDDEERTATVDEPATGEPQDALTGVQPAPTSAARRQTHAVGRRQFPVHLGHAQPPDSKQLSSTPPADGSDSPGVEAAVPESTGAPQIALTGASKVRAHLRKPGLPSILNTKDLAGQLDMQEEETAAVLAELSREPDSRLSEIRPGYWLLKQIDEDA